jgi:hypothetical protein
MRARFGENWGWLAALVVLLPLGVLVYLRAGDEEPTGPVVVFNSSTTATVLSPTGTGAPTALDGLAAESVAARVERELAVTCGDPQPALSASGAAVLVRTCTGSDGGPSATISGLTIDDVSAVQIDAAPGPAADAVDEFDDFGELAIGGATPDDVTLWLQTTVPLVADQPVGTVIAGVPYELSFVEGHYRLVIGTA